jgi:chromosome segregation ATPase
MANRRVSNFQNLTSTL